LFALASSRFSNFDSMEAFFTELFLILGFLAAQTIPALN
jgi:hypothetical protein